MNIYIMARTIMIADKIYEELKGLKGKNKSFTEVIAEALEASRPKKKLGAALKEVAGILEGDREYDEVMKWSKKMWNKWDRRLNRELKKEWS